MTVAPQCWAGAGHHTRTSAGCVRIDPARTTAHATIAPSGTQRVVHLGSAPGTPTIRADVAPSRLAPSSSPLCTRNDVVCSTAPMSCRTCAMATPTATHGADTELLPLLTTHAESLLAAAKVVVASRVAPYGIALTENELDAAIDMVVRVVLSHVMQPTDTPEKTSDDIAWIAARVLR